MAKVYVFRINYDDQFETVRGELLAGRLRQGWGCVGMSVDQGEAGYIAGWKAAYGGDEGARRKYNIISKMKEMKPGDFVVVPKISADQPGICWNNMIIAEVTEAYRFEPLTLPERGGETDFGHIIPVTLRLSCPYDFDNNTRVIASKFRAYQSAVNRVFNEAFSSAVTELMAQFPDGGLVLDRGISDSEALNQATAEAWKAYLDSIVDALRRWDNTRFEKVIADLFEQNGYAKIGNNHYDGKGGDIDIQFAQPTDSLMDQIANLQTISVERPEIWVQAKKKTGTDNDDCEGINQLLNMQETLSPETNPVMILISLADGFTEKAKELAKANNVFLIDGRSFAALLLRYGLMGAFFAGEVLL
jgi:hypothetical protein